MTISDEERKILKVVEVGEYMPSSTDALQASSIGVRLAHLGLIEFKQKEFHEHSTYLTVRATPKGCQELGQVLFVKTCSCGQFTWDRYTDPLYLLHTLCGSCDDCKSWKYEKGQWVEKRAEEIDG